MRPWITNARMYAVTPQIETAWRALLGEISREADAPLDYFPYPAPQPLEDLWSRPDLGAVFMCGYPIALELAPVVPIAAPRPRADWAQGRAVYRTDLIVRRDAPYRCLEDTFGGRAGFTVAHSQSGFNALRHHLLGFRTTARRELYGEMLGDLLTARRVLDAVAEGRIDIGPLDAYWHMLLARAAPGIAAQVRTLEATEPVPMPALVAAAAAPADMVARLRAAFIDAATRPWFPRWGDVLQIDGFSPADRADYGVLLEWRRAALAAGYPLPA